MKSNHENKPTTKRKQRRYSQKQNKAKKGEVGNIEETNRDTQIKRKPQNKQRKKKKETNTRIKTERKRKNRKQK